MRRLVIPAAGALVVVGLAACSSGDLGRCFEPGATAYPVHAPGDTAFVFRWPGSFMPVRVYAESTGSLRTNVVNGMQLWVNAFRCGELSLQLWPDSTTADIVVRNPPSLPAPQTSAAPLSAGDSTSACLGRTDVAPPDVEGRLVRPIRSFVAPNSIDTALVESCYHFVTAHELGHALGLLSHSTDLSDLMYEVPRRAVLTADDRYTIQLLYHLDAPVKPEPR